MARRGIERFLVGFAGSAFLCLLVLGGSPAAFAESTLLPPIPLGKAPGAVAVDPARHLAFVADDGITGLHVVDLAKRRVIGSVPLGAGPADVAVDVELGLILALDPAKGSLRLVDQESGREAGAVPIGPIPVSVAVDASFHHAVVLEAKAGRLLVVDLVTRRVVRTVAVGPGLRAVAVHEPTHTAIVLKGESLLVYDFLSGERTGDLALPAPGTALAVLPDPAWAVVALETPHGIILVDIAALHVLATLSLSTAQSIAVHPLTGESVAIDTGSKTLLRISLQDRLVLEKLDLPAEPLSVAVDPGLHLAVVPILSDAGGFLQLVQLPVPPASVEGAKSVAGAGPSSGASGRAGPGAASPGAPVPPAGTTVLMGRVLETGKKPLANVTVRVGDRAVKTDAGGNFMIVGPPPGDQLVMLEGSTASTPTAPTAAYPHIPVKVRIEEGRVTELPYVPHLHAQKRHAFVDIRDKARERRHTDPSIPGFEMRIPPGAEIIGWDGKPNERVNVRTVPADRLPIPPPPTKRASQVYMFYFDKPGGGIPTQPIPVTLPNDLGLPPGEKADLFYFDEASTVEGASFTWMPGGRGTVSEDGKRIIPDPGTGTSRFCCGALLYIPYDDNTPDDSPNCKNLGGDPVDLATGTFRHEQIDLVVPWRIPVRIARTHRTRDATFGPFGVGTYLNYDWYVYRYGTDNANARLSLPASIRFVFAKQPDGSYINTTDPDHLGSILTFAPDGTAALRMKDGTTYGFDTRGLLVNQVDRNGNRLSFERGVLGNVERIKDTSGRTLVTLTTTSINGRVFVQKIADHTGREVVYTYESPFSVARLRQVTYPDGATMRYVYERTDFPNHISSVTNARGIREVLNEFDAAGRVVRQIHADGGVYTYSYTLDAQGRVTQTVMTDALGQAVTRAFNQKLYGTQDADPLGNVTLYERAAASNLLLSVTDALGRKSTFTYDSRGNLLTQTDPAGNVTTYTYEANFNQVASVTNALGQTTVYSHDSQGNVTAVTDPLGNVTGIGYNASGQPTSVTDPLGNVTAMEYDAQGNLVKTTDPLGNGVSRTYDVLGRVLSMIDPLGRTTAYQYDLRDRLTSITDPAGGITSYQYDGSGILLTVIDAKGQEMAFAYTLRDKAASFTDGLGRTEVYGHDASDNLTSITDRKGQTSIFTYDAANRRTGAIYADGSTTTYTRDALGRVTEINDSISGPIRYTYGTFGCGSGGCGGEGGDRVVEEETSQGVVSYTFDAIGRRTGMAVTVGANPVFAQNYEYDAASR
ncbi:MAG: hypothetical protein HY039_13440, partial [Nitrospirae bacterium]|nr:hypothetical protein [Nitrospirota bacterium]